MHFTCCETITMSFGYMLMWYPRFNWFNIGVVIVDFNVFVPSFYITFDKKSSLPSYTKNFKFSNDHLIIKIVECFREINKYTQDYILYFDGAYDKLFLVYQSKFSRAFFFLNLNSDWLIMLRSSNHLIRRLKIFL